MVESHTKRQGSMCSSKKERWFTLACHRLTSVTASRYKLYVIGIFNTGPFFLIFFFVKSNDSEWINFNLWENCVTWNHLYDVNNFVCKVWYDNTKIRCVWSKLQMYLCNLFKWNRHTWAIMIDRKLAGIYRSGILEPSQFLGLRKRMLKSRRNSI